MAKKLTRAVKGRIGCSAASVEEFVGRILDAERLTRKAAKRGTRGK